MQQAFVLAVLTRLALTITATFAVIFTLLPHAPVVAQEAAQSLVYLDRSSGVSTEVWLASLDGGSRRKVVSLNREVTLPGTGRVLAGGTLVLVEGDQILLLDLSSAQIRSVAGGPNLSSVYLLDDGTLFVTNRRGCGPSEAVTRLGRLDPSSDRLVEVATFASPGLEIVWAESAGRTVLVVARACDPGIDGLVRLDGNSGQELGRFDVNGCGWVRVAPDGRQALVTRAYCSADAAPELSLYDLVNGTRRDVSYGKDAPSLHAFVVSPDGARAAFGLALNRRQPGVRPASGGIWLLDLASLQSAQLWADGGLESWAVDWSPDGSRLLAASVQAQGRCGYAVLDTVSGVATPVSTEIWVCGANGSVIGFAPVAP